MLRLALCYTATLLAHASATSCPFMWSQANFAALMQDLLRVWRVTWQTWRNKLYLRDKLVTTAAAIKHGLVERCFRHWKAKVDHKVDWRFFQEDCLLKMAQFRYLQEVLETFVCLVPLCMLYIFLSFGQMLVPWLAAMLTQRQTASHRLVRNPISLMLPPSLLSPSCHDHKLCCAQATQGSSALEIKGPCEDCSTADPLLSPASQGPAERSNCICCVVSVPNAPRCQEDESAVCTAALGKVTVTERLECLAGQNSRVGHKVRSACFVHVSTA